jgi:hypothetical protein
MRPSRAIKIFASLYSSKSRTIRAWAAWLPAIGIGKSDLLVLFFRARLKMIRPPPAIAFLRLQQNEERAL